MTPSNQLLGADLKSPNNNLQQIGGSTKNSRHNSRQNSNAGSNSGKITLPGEKPAFAPNKPVETKLMSFADRKFFVGLFEEKVRFIRIVARFRQMNCMERLDPWLRQRGYAIINSRVISVGFGDRTQNFKFPSPILPEESTQEDAFDQVKKMVDSALDGGKCSVFAIGQNGSGKSYTISGNRFNPGIVQQTISYVWLAAKSFDWLILRCKMVQIYKSEVLDLILSEDYRLCPAKVFVAEGQAHILGVTEYEFTVKTTDAEQLLEVYQQGLENRIVRFP